MVKKRRTNEDRQAPLFWGLTPNQLVGHNLWRARKERGWTQAEAAEALEPHLGIRWTVAQVSAAERSIDGNRIHEVMQYLDPALMTRAQRQIHDLAKRRLLAIVEKAIGNLATWQYTLRAMADDLGVLAAETAENLSNSFPDVNAQDVAALVTGPGEGRSDEHSRAGSPVTDEVVE